MEIAGRPRFRFQYSLRTLFAITAIVALLLVPVAWVARERRQVLEAREAALRAVVRAERDRALAVEARYYAADRGRRSGFELPSAEESARPECRQLIGKHFPPGRKAREDSGARSRAAHP